MSCVRPGVLLTNARRRPLRAFSALDLPAFERPANAISPSLSGSSSSFATLLKKTAPENAGMAGKCPNLLEYQLFGHALPSEGKTMKRVPARLALTFCAALLCRSSLGFAQDATPRPDASKGQGIASRVCAACHGPDGNSPTAANPKLAGQI